jgi:hypothetical protein
MTAKSQESAPPKTRTRTATVSYPYHPLELCVDLAKAVREIGNGKQEVSKSLLASHMKIDEQSSDFSQKIASAKCYGLIEGRNGFQLTDLARGLFFPTQDPDRERRIALLEAVNAPGAYANLIARYDGSKPPAQDLIGNVLSQQMGIPESWRMRVAAFFLRSMQYAGAVSADGHFRHKAEMEKLRGSHQGPRPAHNGSGNDALVTPPFSQPPLENSPPPATHDDLSRDDVEVWTYRVEGKPFRIEYPANMTKEVWEKLKRFLHALEPSA